jgi:hypothetical protein
MKSIATKQFIKLRQQLESERTQITARLKEVDAALGSFRSPVTASKSTGKKRGPKPGSKKKVSNELSLKEAIVKAIGNKQMTREQILEGVLATGYRFRTSNPLNSLNVILYGKKPKFSRKDGKFELA